MADSAGSNNSNVYNEGQENLSLEVVEHTGADPSVSPKTTIVSFVLDQQQQQQQQQQGRKSWRNMVNWERLDKLSILYGLVVVLMGVVFPVTEALRDTWFTELEIAYFHVYLLTVSIIFLVYCEIIIVLRKRRTMQPKAEDEEDPPATVPSDVIMVRRRSSADILDGQLISNIQPSQGENASLNISPQKSADPSSIRPGTSRSLAQVKGDMASSVRGASSVSNFDEHMDDIVEYISLRSATASRGHEATSLYLRAGCLVFGIVNMLYVCLELEYYLGGHVSTSCPTYPVIWPGYFHLAFLVVQTYFLFKNRTLPPFRSQLLLRFGMMHLIATNMCIWLRFLVREVGGGVLDLHSLPELSAGPAPSENGTGMVCYDMDSVYEEASPFLFPFILEYSLIAVGTYTGMFHGLGVKVTKDIFTKVKAIVQGGNIKKTEELGGGRGAHAETTFEKAHRGLFLGFLVLTGTVISIILFFFFLRDPETEYKATWTYLITDICICSLMLLAVVVGLVKISGLGFTEQRNNTLDVILLIISMVGLFLFNMFTMMADFVYINEGDFDTATILDGSGSLLSTVQALLQTAFIVDGLQRYSPSRKQREEKPGRGTVTFLIMLNVSTWIFRTFQAKEVALGSMREFYGETAWPMIMNINLPLLLFFRFHSSVCLADMYFMAYEPES